MTDQVGNKLLGLMQALAVQQGTNKSVSKTADSLEPSDFQKQIEKFQKDQSTSNSSSDSKDTATADTTTTETVEKPAAEESVQAPKDELAETQERMVLAAMATLQAPVIVTETPEPPVEVEETVLETTALTMDGTIISKDLAAGDQKPSVMVHGEEMPVQTAEVPVEQKAEAQPQRQNQDAFEGELKETAQEIQPQESQAKAEAVQPEETQPVKAEHTDRTEQLPVNRDEGEDVQVVDVEQAPQALFQNVEAAPIKVGETQTAAPEQTEETQNVGDQLADPLAQALEKGESRVEINLTPESLGSVRVEITRSEDGSLHVALSAETMQTRNLLEKHVGNLQNLLVDRNQGNVQVEVQRQQESQQNQNEQQNPNNNPYDGRNGHGQGQQQEQQRRGQQNSERSEDFLQQLRLGLIPTDGE